MIEKIKELRVKIDKLMIAADKYKNNKSPEAILAWRRLQIAKCWLGKSLDDFNATNPYKVVDNPKDIPATADTYKCDDVVLDSDSLNVVNFLREEIKNLITEIADLQLPFKSVELSLVNLQETRFYYGFELQNIKTAFDKTQITQQNGNS